MHVLYRFYVEAPLRLPVTGAGDRELCLDAGYPPRSPILLHVELEPVYTHDTLEVDMLRIRSRIFDARGEEYEFVEHMSAADVADHVLGTCEFCLHDEPRRNTTVAFELLFTQKAKTSRPVMICVPDRDAPGGEYHHAFRLAGFTGRLSFRRTDEGRYAGVDILLAQSVSVGHGRSRLPLSRRGA